MSPKKNDKNPVPAAGEGCELPPKKQKIAEVSTPVQTQLKPTLPEDVSSPVQPQLKPTLPEEVLPLVQAQLKPTLPEEPAPEDFNKVEASVFMMKVTPWVGTSAFCQSVVSSSGSSTSSSSSSGSSAW